VRRTRLIAARKAIGKSQEQVGAEVGVDRTTVGTWERGEYSPHPYQRTAYASALGVTLDELDALLTGLPRPDDRTPVWMSQYLGMEQSAEEIRAHEPHVVYGLLQTPDYADAIARSAGLAPAPESYVRRITKQRAMRQARVNDGGVSVAVVQPEIALRLKVGTDAVMAEQLSHLVALGSRQNVTIQIVPFAAGHYDALRMGGIIVMTHPWAQGVSVYFERYEGAVLVEDPDEAANFVAAHDHASEIALSPDASLAFIAEAAERWGANDA
jgi:transcriptional regulator with XRE-family HTH domain